MGPDRWTVRFQSGREQTVEGLISFEGNWIFVRAGSDPERVVLVINRDAVETYVPESIG